MLIFFARRAFVKFGVPEKSQTFWGEEKLMKQSLTIRLRVVSTVKSVWTRCTTVLKEIIFTIYAPVIRSVFVLYYAVSTVDPRSITTAVETKNSPPDCFINVSTVLKEIIFIIQRPCKSEGAYFFCTTCFHKIRGNQIVTNISELRKYIIVV